MEEVVNTRIGEHRIDSDEIERFVDEIVDIANKKLKQARVRKYIYWTTVFVTDSLSKYKAQRGMTWEDRYDHAITASASQEFLDPRADRFLFVQSQHILNSSLREWTPQPSSSLTRYERRSPRVVSRRTKTVSTTQLEARQPSVLGAVSK